MKKLVAFSIVLLFSTMLFIFHIPSNFSASNDYHLIDAHLGMLDFSAVDSIIQRSSESVRNIRLGDLAFDAITGELDLSPRAITDTLFSLFFAEVRALVVTMRHLILIAILSAFFTAFTSSFKSAGVSEVGFYVNYLAIIALLLSSFAVGIGLMIGMAEIMSDLMIAALPLIASLAVMSGSVTAGYVFNPAIIFFTGFLVNTMRYVVIPLIVSAAVMQILSYLSKKEMLEKLSILIRNVVSWGLRISAGLFITILALHRFSTAPLNSALVRSSRFMLNLIPVVGTSLSGAADAVMYWSGAVRGGVLTAIIIVIILMCAIPLIQLAAFTLIYKLTAGLIQPICDERIVKAVDTAGSYTALMLGVCVLLSTTFIFAVIIVLSV